MAKERQEQTTDVAFEMEELAGIYVRRGVEPELARTVAEQLMAKDALTAHARDELGISDATGAKPVQAAFASALTFSVGAAMPLALAVVSPLSSIMPVIGVGALICLAALGVVGAKAGGATPLKSALRVAFWGALAMMVTTLIGRLFGAVA